ncbi:MAG TPA: DUF1365 domain-containing protein [Solirubrobacteraceae bacterium]|nr:DUF1365 domain-containing protein [Solirubrobacteraceae bacterium]
MTGTASCIYEGAIHHRRAQPRRQFRHRLALFYIDLDELPTLLGGRFVDPRPGLLRFRRRDYLGPAEVSLERSVRDAVETDTGASPSGPIRVLTQLRSFGHCFNPVSFYYCLDDAGEQVESVVSEVTNTPWGERHAYVVPGGTAYVDKSLHVSPFMAMDHRYTVHTETPGERLAVHIESRRGEELTFDATLALRRRELTRVSAARIAARYPFANLRVLALIYGHAIGLALAGARVHPHPKASAA